MEDIDRQAIKDKGWAFGKVFTCQSAELIVNRITSGNLKCKDFIYIAITHDCSVISPSLKKEPYLEYLCAQKVDKEDAQFINARNIRRLHFQIKHKGKDTWYDLSMGARGFVSRESIDKCNTDNNFLLSTENINLLKRWLANRYTSQSFPDCFNRLTGHLVKNSRAPLIKAFNSDTGKACNSIFISLEPHDRDLNQDESYTVDIVLLFRDEIAHKIERKAMDDFGKTIGGILESVGELNPVRVFSLAESDATYSQITKMSRWQLDYISLKDGSEILIVDHS